MRLNSTDIIHTICSKHPELKKRDAIKLMKLYFTEVKYAIADGDDVMVSDFGKFTSRDEPVRNRYNLAKGKVLPSGGKRLPVFRPSKNFKDLM